MRTERIKMNINFNPRPREEGDLRVLLIVHYLKHFNPRPREEGDKRLHIPSL